MGRNEDSTTLRKDIAQGKKNSIATRLKRVIDSLGPGITTGASNDDPSGIAIYSQAVGLSNAEYMLRGSRELT